MYEEVNHLDSRTFLKTSFTVSDLALCMEYVPANCFAMKIYAKIDIPVLRPKIHVVIFIFII